MESHRKQIMDAVTDSDDFDVYAFVQAKRDGRPIKRPKKIESHTDDRGWIAMCNETGRPCVDDKKAMRVLLIADLRKGHPRLKPGLLGRTIPKTSDYYRYVGVQFDNGVVEVVSISAIQPIEEDAGEASESIVRNEIKDTAFDWDDRVAEKCLREWELKKFPGSLDLSQMLRGGAGPHEVYAYTFPSLIALANALGQQHYPVKIGYTGVASELAPSLTRIDGQLGDTAGRFEAALILGVWNSWNGRSLESRIHSHLRRLGRKVQSAVGREWYNTHVDELCELVQAMAVTERSGVPLNGPVPDSFQGFQSPSRTLAESLQVLCCRMDPGGMAMIKSIAFDDLLEEAVTPEVRQSRAERDA
jgi:hypothetical protein